ncbi:Fic family protein [Candidatus Microgenomates bacterium]|nr:Fic family protein [Candidatus Microgenomates bacterium]
MYSPKYTITNKILSQIGIIEAAKEIITNAPLVPAWEARFREEALVRSVHYGTHLEGNSLNLSQAAQVLSGQEVVARERDIQEVLNYRNVLKYIEEFQSNNLSEKKPLTTEVLKKIHRLTVEKILPPEQCGVFRTNQVVVKNSLTGEVSFRPPSAVEVPFLLDSLTSWLNDKDTAEVHPVLQAGVVHYEFVRIHPFLDGNGRVARSLATLVLFLGGYDIKHFFSLEEHYDKDAESYYKALQSVDKRIVESEHSGDGDLTFWLEYFSQGLAIELVRIRERVQKLSVDIKIKEHLGGQQVALNERQLKMMEYIQQTGFIQSQIFREMFPDYSDDTILRDLKDLIEKGVLKKEGATKSARYVLIK